MLKNVLIKHVHSLYFKNNFGITKKNTTPFPFCEKSSAAESTVYEIGITYKMHDKKDNTVVLASMATVSICN